MTRWLLSESAAQDLEEPCDFLLERFPEHAVQTVDVVLGALEVLTQHPLMGRPIGQGLRELVISRGRSGYLALYEFDPIADIAVVHATRHQRESDDH
jgi:plasmid stabilization system protein ParE